MILNNIGDLDGALRLHKEDEAICRRLNDPVGLSASLGNQALILKATGDLDGALRLHKEEQAICRRLNDPNGLAISPVNQGSLMAFDLRRPDEGFTLAEEASQIAAKHGLPALSQQVEPIANRIRALLQPPPP